MEKITENLKIVLDIIKRNLVYVILVIAVIVGFFALVVPKMTGSIGAVKNMKEQEASYKQLKEQYDALKFQRDAQNRSKKVLKDGKVIYDAPGLQFSPDASFAPLFELVLSIAQQSGIRIRAIDYNYQPQEDLIFASKLQGYNACELSIVAVGTYSEFQTFFKTIMKEEYLSSIAEIEVTPWNKDKKVLINKFKIRLYTRTMS